MCRGRFGAEGLRSHFQGFLERRMRVLSQIVRLPDGRIGKG